MVSFLSILFLVTLAILLVYFGGALYDASKQIYIAPYVFQPALLSEDRIGRPVTLDSLSDEFVHDRLMKKFVHEYFYVVPDPNNVLTRMASGPLTTMASKDVFRHWIEKVAPEISKLSESKALRQVFVHDTIQPVGDYYVVTYDLVTYNRPNDLSAAPTVQSGLQMHLMRRFKKEILDETDAGAPFDAKKYLKGGGDPATIFKFEVTEIR